MALMATCEVFEKEDLAGKVIPAMSICLVDREKCVARRPALAGPASSLSCSLSLADAVLPGSQDRARPGVQGDGHVRQEVRGAHGQHGALPLSLCLFVSLPRLLDPDDVDANARSPTPLSRPKPPRSSRRSKLPLRPSPGSRRARPVRRVRSPGGPLRASRRRCVLARWVAVLFLLKRALTLPLPPSLAAALDRRARRPDRAPRLVARQRQRARRAARRVRQRPEPRAAAHVERERRAVVGWWVRQPGRRRRAQGHRGLGRRLDGRQRRRWRLGCVVSLSLPTIECSPTEPIADTRLPVARRRVRVRRRPSSPSRPSRRSPLLCARQARRPPRRLSPPRRRLAQLGPARPARHGRERQLGPRRR